MWNLGRSEPEGVETKLNRGPFRGCIVSSPPHELLEIAKSLSLHFLEAKVKR